ncbi:MAG: hypothetical protein NTW94_02785, partial [Legionellales bacterium]|nr:hypothetical protein [Legionellales bacterium]
QMQTAPAAEIDYQMKESIKYCEKNNMSVLVQLFKNPRMNTKHLRDGSKKDIISFIKKLLSLPIGYTLETFLEQMKDPASALFRHFHQNHVAISAITELEVTESLSTQKKNLLLATIYCREIEILRLEGGALKEMMQVEKNRAVFRSLFQGGDFYKTLKSLSHSQVILICNALLPHLDLILKENPKIGNQLKILTEKNPKIARAVLESFDSPLLNALVNNSAPWDGTMFARPEYDGAMRAAILMENTHFILKVNEIRGVAMAHLPNSMGEVLLDGLDKLPKNHPDKVLFMRLMNERPSSTLRTYLETILPETTSSKFFCMPESELLIERARILERAERMAVTISAEIASLSTSQATVALKSKLSGLRAHGRGVSRGIKSIKSMGSSLLMTYIATLVR